MICVKLVKLGNSGLLAEGAFCFLILCQSQHSSKLLANHSTVGQDWAKHSSGNK